MVFYLVFWETTEIELCEAALFLATFLWGTNTFAGVALQKNAS